MLTMFSGEQSIDCIEGHTEDEKWWEQEPGLAAEGKVEAKEGREQPGENCDLVGGEAPRGQTVG